MSPTLTESVSPTVVLSISSFGKSSPLFILILISLHFSGGRSLPSETDVALNPAQKRHARVKNWTKNVNLFDKDFIIIPINEHCHWFLAIVCFPSLDGTFTLEGQPVKVEPKQKKSRCY